MMHRRLATWFAGVWAVVLLGPGALAQTIYPTADGTLVDGGGFGVFDGVADQADWSFNQSSYEGAIGLTRSPQTFEQRVVWEYNLPAGSAPPITAKLTFTLRGADRFPAEPAPVQVYSYPADGLESLADFSAGPGTLLAEESIEPFQPSTAFVVNISPLVNEALFSVPLARVALRFQIDPQAQADSNQAFIDAVDSDPTTKPAITIINRVPGDYDNDRDVDLADFAALSNCVAGSNISVSSACRVLDDDFDNDVDLFDFVAFVHNLVAWGD